MYRIIVALSLSILGEKHVDLVIFTKLVKLIKSTCESGVLSTWIVYQTDWIHTEDSIRHSLDWKEGPHTRCGATGYSLS